MAKQDTIFRFTGRLGGAIGYVRNGVHCVRSAPLEVKQSTATKKAAKDFGQASKGARMLRYAMEKEIFLHHDRGINNRLNKAMGAILRADTANQPGRRRFTAGNLKQLQGFRLNGYASIKSEIRVQRTFDGSILVTCVNPQQQFAHLAQVMQFRAVALLPDFGLGSCKTAVSETIRLTREQANAPFTLHLPVKPGQTVIVVLEAIACRTFDGRIVRMGYRQFNAADVVAVMAPMKERLAAKTFVEQVYEEDVYNRPVFTADGVYTGDQERRE